MFCDANKVSLRINKWRERRLRPTSPFFFFTEGIFRACIHIGLLYFNNIRTLARLLLRTYLISFTPRPAELNKNAFTPEEFHVKVIFSIKIA